MSTATATDTLPRPVEGMTRAAVYEELLTAAPTAAPLPAPCLAWHRTGEGVRLTATYYRPTRQGGAVTVGVTAASLLGAWRAAAALGIIPLSRMLDRSAIRAFYVMGGSR